MSILEDKSAIRVKALKGLVDKGQYPVEYAIDRLDEKNKQGLITATDYEETFTYFEELLNKEELIEETEEDTAEQNDAEETVDSTKNSTESEVE